MNSTLVVAARRGKRPGTTAIRWRIPVGVSYSCAILVALLLSLQPGFGQGADSDNDGIPDDWEATYAFDPNNAADAATDPDGDGVTNLNEYRADTNPLDPASFLRMTSISVSANGVFVQFSSRAGLLYTVEYKDSLESSTWTLLTQVAAAGSSTAVSDSSAVASRYYRVAVQRSAIVPLAYSVNTVGFVNVPVSAGTNWITRPMLTTANNTVEWLIPYAPDDTCIFRWNSSAQVYEAACYFFGYWDPPGLQLIPGEAFYLETPAPFTLTFAGEVIPVPLPAITVQPQSQSVRTGTNVTFSVTATGSGLSYQWRKNGADVTGATSSTFTISGVQVTNAANYSVAVSNSGGTATSSNALLMVQPAFTRVANVLWVSDNGPPGFSGPTAGTADDAFVALLQSAGHHVARFNPPDSQNTLLTAADLEALNTNDLIIIGRSIASTAFQSPQGAQWNTNITRPVIAMSSYTTRSSRMGWVTGENLPDGTPGPLMAVDLSDPETAYLFGGVGLSGNTTLGAFDEPVDRNTSLFSDAPQGGGIVLAQTVNGVVGAAIAEWQAGSVVKAGANILAGYRIFFAGGSRETNGGAVATAGKENLTPSGEFIFLRAVELAANGGVVPGPFEPVPLITSLSVHSAGVGSSVTITGSNFDPIASGNIVYFGTVPATVTSATSTQLVVTVPAGAAYAPVSVTVDGLTGSSRLPFGVSFASGGPIGTNLFAPPVTFLPVPQFSDRHAAGDIDGDGRNDLVVSYHSDAGTSTMRVFTNRASPGSFTANSLNAGFDVDSGQAVSVGDLDGDGKLDLLAYRYVTGPPLRTEWDVHRNTSSPGALAFTKSVVLPTNGMFLELIGIGDLDGDGRPDLLGKSTNNVFFALRNASAPGSVIFEPPVPLIASCGMLADNAHFADLDGDGKLDILLGGGNGCPIEIFRSLATPGTLNTNSFARPFALPFAPGRHPLAIADYDGDGKLDIAALGDCENIVRVYRNVAVPGALGTNSFAPPVSFAAGGWPYALLTTDLDGDGRPDIVTAGCATNDLYCGAICGTNFFSVLENISVPGAISSNSFAAPVTFSAGSRGAFPLASDMDGDGRPDLIVRTYVGYFSVWRNTMPALPLGAPSILVNGTLRLGQSVTVTNGAVVEIQTAFTSGSIYFTLDGSDPANGQSYTGPFMLTETAIIRAVAYTADFSDFAAAEPITVSLVRSPFAVADPQSQTVAAGSTVEFEAAAGGDAPLTYQWRRNGVAIPGATSSSLILVNVQSVVAGSYSVVVANAYGSVTSGAAALAIIQPPAVESQPASLSVGLNDAAVFCVTASGDPPLRYQWRKNGVNIPNATNQCFTIEQVQVSDGGRYSVVVENDVDAVVSASAQLTINLITVPGGDAFADAIEIFEHCFSGSNVGTTSQPGEPRHAGKVGGRSIWYKWFAPNKGIAIFETTGSAFDTLLAVYTGSEITALNPIAADEDDGGFLNSRVRFNAETNVEYLIVVDGYAGNQGTYSLCWTLETTPVPLPVIITQPTNQTVRETQPVNFSVVATSTVPNIKYQWFLNGAPMPGKTNAVLDISSVLPQDVGYYRVGVSNRVGVSTVFVGLLSDAAILEIGPVPGVQSVDKLPDLFAPPSPLAPSRSGGASGLAAAEVATGVPLSVSAGSTDSQVINNTGSATSPTEPLPCRVLGGASRWLWLVPTDTATLRIDTIGSTIDTVLGIFTGTDAASIVPLPNGCNDNGAPDGLRSLVQFTAQAGVGYYIQADGKSGTSGIIRINWALGTAPSSPQTQAQYVVRQGDSLMLTSTATGIPDPSFQWRRDNGAIANATSRSLPLVNIQPHNGGTYSVIGSNFIGMITSVVATITVQSNAFTAAQDLFDSTHLAWTASPGATVSYQLTGGNPAGYLRFQPGTGGGELEAPAEYLGNKFYCYNGLLSFDLRRATSVHVNVVLVGGGFELALELPTATGTGWTSYKLLLNESAAWRDATSQPPTREEFVALLGALDGLYLGADGTIEVDNLEFLAPTTPVLSLGAATGEWLVQWPIAIGSYTVEAASALDGSAWAPVAATLVAANGLNSMRLPATAGQRFFRLRKTE